jgi:hypothetical protein
MFGKGYVTGKELESLSVREREVVEESGLLRKSQEEEVYFWAHKTFLEYLAAVCVSKSNALSSIDGLVPKIRHDQGHACDLFLVFLTGLTTDEKMLKAVVPLMARDKFKVLQQFDRLLDEMKRIVDGRQVASFGLRKKVLDQMSLVTGIKSSTLSNWTLVAARASIEEEVIRLDKNRRAKALKVMWSPKLARPWFPETEQRLKAEILADRAQHRRFLRSKAMRRYKELAKEENSERFALAKIQNPLIHRFLKRSGLRVRLPGCVKSKPLEVAIKEVRGFLVWCREELYRDTGNYRKNEELDPTYGRFPLAWRVNKDEVPMRFGQTNKTIDMKGTRNVHVSYPDGWGERVATLVLAASADGHILDIVLIFKGNDEASTKAMIQERKGYEEDGRFSLHTTANSKGENALKHCPAATEGPLCDPESLVAASPHKEALASSARTPHASGRSKLCSGKPHVHQRTRCESQIDSRAKASDGC